MVSFTFSFQLVSACKQLIAVLVCIRQTSPYLPPVIYFVHLWNIAAICGPESWKRASFCVQSLASQLLQLSVWLGVASSNLFYLYHFGRCTSALSESVPKPKVFTRVTCKANVMLTSNSVLPVTFSSAQYPVWELISFLFSSSAKFTFFKRRVNRLLRMKTFLWPM